MFGVNVDGNQPPCGPNPPVCPFPGEPGVPKPNLRGFLSQALKVRLITCFSLVTFAAINMRVYHVNARRNRYREFYKAYEPALDFERMKEAGVFKSVLADGSVGGI